MLSKFRKNKNEQSMVSTAVYLLFPLNIFYKQSVLYAVRSTTNGGSTPGPCGGRLNLPTVLFKKL